MKIISIVGARPQFIKLAPFSRYARKYFEEIILHTGQHYDDNMSVNFFEQLDIPKPNYNLNIYAEGHGLQTAKMLIGIEEVLQKEKPALVVVFGDTNSTLAGALASAKLNIPVAHVEAGLRSFNRSMPEEINRIIADHCSDFLFAPTKTAMINLHKEGLGVKSHLTGDIMLDSLTLYKEKADKESSVLDILEVKSKNYLLLTLHRPYNVDDNLNLAGVFDALSNIDSCIIFPVHPRTRKKMLQFGIRPGKNIKIIEPVGYLDFIKLQINAHKIITDSGGIQKEAYLLQIPCITIRPETEWVETVQAGWNTLVGFNGDKLKEAVENFEPSIDRPHIFGEYSCAEKMVRVLSAYFENIN